MLEIGLGACNMFHLKLRRKKSNANITGEDVRRVVREELSLAESNRKDSDSKEKETELKQKKLESLPPQRRLKLLRYLKQKGATVHGKK